MNQKLDLQLLFIDFEVNPKTNDIFKVGALALQYTYDDTLQESSWKVLEKIEESVNRKGELQSLMERLDRCASKADYLIGHNLVEHDLPILREAFPASQLLTLRVFDTLQISPLAFPKNPYHRLLKDYKLIRSELNSPLEDCFSTLKLFDEQLAALLHFAKEERGIAELQVYQKILANINPNYDELFSFITQRPLISDEEFAHLLPNILKITHHDEKSGLNNRLKYRVCMNQLAQLLTGGVLLTPEFSFPLLYTLAWLRVSGDNSVLAPWVRHQFPETANLIYMLREEPCDDERCHYCNVIHDPRSLLQFYFKYDDFRYENLERGESIQKDAVTYGMRGENILAILPTGGGKSLCYQLPALHRYFMNGSLTIIISPLQSLMMDQVDGLVKKGIKSAAALNGLLTLPERSLLFEKLQMGDIGLLYVSPEQFRSRRFKEAIKQREISAWVYDEVHCLSKWGNDFRPDYQYVAKVIKEFREKGMGEGPISCFTATAKLDVLEDIKHHFRSTLDISFIERISHKERENLSFDVRYCEKHEKVPTLLALLNEYLNHQLGGAIIFVSRRRIAEECAEQLTRYGWDSYAFHAGMKGNEKRDIQEQFIRGEIRVIVATNAFGMGVDKDDVRLVVHADIPGSLENYLQEAGRAGRDEGNAACILLYEPNDIEIQFRLTEHSKLTHSDIDAIYKKIRAEQAKRGKEELVISPGEILKDALVESIERDDPQSKTKVYTAIAWLERGGYLSRTDNIVRIFPATLTCPLEEGIEKIKAYSLSERRKLKYISLLTYIAHASPEEPLDTDTLAELIGGDIEEVSYLLHQLKEFGLLINNTQLTVYLRYGIEDSSQRRLELNKRCEEAIIEYFRELHPDLNMGDLLSINLASMTTYLNQHLEGEELPKQLKRYLANGLLLPFHTSRILQAIADEQGVRDDRGYGRRLFSLKIAQQKDYLSLLVEQAITWQEVTEYSQLRHTVADKILGHLLARAREGGQRGKNILVSSSFEEICSDLFSDPLLASEVESPKAQSDIVERALLYLHTLDILTLNHGMAIMRNAVTLKVPTDRDRRYLKRDYELLEFHYKERRTQIHVMREYAVLGLEKMRNALRYLYEYFTLPEQHFYKKHFRGREKILQLATSEESWRKITEPLNEVQRAIVESGDENRLILAGPGSGKTLVIVHRIAYLLRVERIPAHAIIALTYNRAAANEIRQRLYQLVGNESYGIVVMTYHALSMRLTGRIYDVEESNLTQNNGVDYFKLMIKDAIELLQEDQTENVGVEAEEQEDEIELRAKLLRGYRYILVDEYQDIDEDQYNLISALAGRNNPDDGGKLTILAVGDDDQNIYSFRGTSNEYIDRFKEDYSAEISYMVENYRSTKAIIAASNEVIALNSNRLKKEHPIEINHDRIDAPFGGDWAIKDDKGQGNVVLRTITYPDYRNQAFLVLSDLAYLMKVDPKVIASCAILSRTHEALLPFAGGLEELNVEYYYENDKVRNFHTSTHRYFRKLLQKIEALGEVEDIDQLEKIIERQQLPHRWNEYFAEMLAQLKLEYQELTVPVESIIRWIREYAHDIPIAEKRGVFLGTIHSAKGLEFDHLFLIDHLNHFQEAQEVECRLYYVGMTRAKCTLYLYSFRDHHPFASNITQLIRSTPFDKKMVNNPSLEQRYHLISPDELYLDYLATRHTKREQEASLSLKEGDPLRMEWRENGHCYFIDPVQNRVVARSSNKFRNEYSEYFKQAEIINVTVHSLIARHREKVSPEFQKYCNTEEWESVQPLIIYKKI